ncbi:MAG: hypothetical protein VCB25_05970 [Myxococcota bacterium]
MDLGSNRAEQALGLLGVGRIRQQETSRSRKLFTMSIDEVEFSLEVPFESEQECGRSDRTGEDVFVGGTGQSIRFGETRQACETAALLCAAMNDPELRHGFQEMSTAGRVHAG